MVVWTAVNVIMNGDQNTGHVQVITHNLDGSETIVEYDNNEEPREDGSPAIDHITFMDADASSWLIVKNVHRTFSYASPYKFIP